MRKDIVIALVAIVAVAAVAFGLSNVARDLPLTPSQPIASKKDAKPAKKTDSSDKVVMHVNGEAITEREFHAFLMAAPEQARALYASPMARRAVADELVKLKTLQQEGERLGIDRDPDVESQIEMVRAQITAGRALEKLVSDRAEEKVRAAYAKERAGYVVLRHIAIAYEGGQLPAREQKPPASLSAAMSKGQEIANRLRAGADFTRTAARESDDTQSASQGGLIGAAKLADLPRMLGPDVAGVVAKIKPGQVSDPVQTQFAVHVFRVDAPSMEDLRPTLLQEIRQQTMEDEVARLHKSAKVELDPKFFPEQPKPPTKATP